MGTKRNPGEHDCFDTAMPDEPTFTLLARDTSAPHMVRSWAYQREREIAAGRKPSADRPKVEEARACADDMEHWRRDNDGAWRDYKPASHTHTGPMTAARALQLSEATSAVHQACTDVELASAAATLMQAAYKMALVAYFRAEGLEGHHHKPE